MSGAPPDPISYQSTLPSPRQDGRASTVICWILIAFIAIGVPILREWGARTQAAAPATAPATLPAAGPAVAGTSADEPVIDFQTEIVGRYALAAAKFEKEAAGPLVEQMDKQVHSPQGRLATGVMAVELLGRDQGIPRVRASGSADAAAFVELYTHGTPLPPDISRRYGFFARVAEIVDLPTDDPQRRAVLGDAQRVILAGAGAFSVIAVLGIAGLALLVIAITLAATGRMTFRMRPPVGRASLYVEAFTVYLLGFLIGSILISLFFRKAGLGVHGVMMSAAVALAVVWPVLRGQVWATQRLDWGLTAGRGIFVEMFCGLIGYIGGLPIVGFGILLMLLLGRLAASSPAVNPAVQLIVDHPIEVFILATVFAPLTEETLFRGALLSHVRRRLGMVLSAIITGTIFAAVHPQGWIAIPALASIGAVLAMIRQWRGSLLPSMTAHALNNATVLTFVLLIR